MREILERIGDIDVLLALEPEDLGTQLLFALKTRAESGGDNRFSCIGIKNEFDGQGMTHSSRLSLEKSLIEAFSWMESEGLAVHSDTTNGPNGHRILSRRALKMDSEEMLTSYASFKLLPKKILHPDIAEDVWLSFARQDFAEAVFKAMRAVEIAVRDAAGFAEGEHGVPMIRKAFHKDNGPLADANQHEAEREALMHLFAGAIGSYKNPHSHRRVELEQGDEALEIVLLANHLLRIVDARR